jgi:hypothetical protein
LGVDFALFAADRLTSPEIGTSVREGAKRYNPNLSEEEPLFNASTFRLGCASIMA